MGWRTKHIVVPHNSLLLLAFILEEKGAHLPEALETPTAFKKEDNSLVRGGAVKSVMVGIDLHREGKRE